ncbi:type IX secretion system protein PorQ [Rhodonellum sp.]|uniref:type IX secretion system protein PorQ n=1 Tax=Rhodonellum sp. TaxID=2231180 RepID=UPI002725EFE5|nr:type IX secretion system protein PorQ [Rhodonellum sp.]MDO9554000.1 type IX secretion system protein PorQ [Rhodonellum sp.]
MKYTKPYLYLMVLGCYMAAQHLSWGQANRRSFNFIENPTFTKLAGLGGVNLTAGNDPLMFLANPALLDSGSTGMPAFHYLNFPGGIHVATVGFNFNHGEKGIIGIGLQYFDYGKFDGFDPSGIPTGDFNAREFALTIGYGMGQGVFRYGANFKLLGSILESYQAYAIALDFGVNFVHPDQDIVLGINARNIGFTVIPYFEGEKMQLPTDLRIGGSYKPEFAPFRFHLTLRNLQSREVGFFVPDPFLNGEGVSTADKFFRRVVIGMELLPSEHFTLRLGYNHLIRKEFETSSGAGAGGFSGGFAFRVKKFELSYSRMFYNVPGGSNIFGVSTTINEKRTF